MRDCATCEYFHETVRDEGNCRRYPPELLSEPGNHPRPPLWPAVRRGFWCGEYARRETTGS